MLFKYSQITDIPVRIGKYDIGRNRLGVETKSMVYKVAFQRADRVIETLYWNGSLEQTISLARSVALECGFEGFRIFEFGGSGAEVFSEQLPYSRNG